MNEAQHDQAQSHDAVTSEGATPGEPSSGESVTVLRGGAAVGVGRAMWLYAGAVALLIFAIVIVVSFLSAANDNSRIDRLKSHGIPVTVTVTNCIGNLGGSGSNASSYTCSGNYSVGGTRYQETIGAMSVSAAPGAHVRAVADPSRPSTVVIASAVASSTASAKVYVAPGLLSVLLITLAWWFLVVARRTRYSQRRTGTGPA